MSAAVVDLGRTEELTAALAGRVHRQRAVSALKRLGILLAFGWAMSSAGIWLNLSPSMPVGLYRSSRVADRSGLRRGLLVAACLPESLASWARTRGYLIRGRCPNGTAPVGKPIFAVEGDTVTVRPDGVSRNGENAANSRPLARDRAGRPLWRVPYGTYPVTTGQLWLISTHTPLSFDSRYFGPVRGDDVIALLDPLVVYNAKHGN